VPGHVVVVDLLNYPGDARTRRAPRTQEVSMGTTTRTRLLALAALPLVAATTLLAVPAQAAAPPACTHGDVSIAYRGGDHATLHTTGRLVVRNTSGSACSLHGFGGLSYVGGGDGTQVGAAADRDPGTPVRTVVLAPGARARSAIQETSYAAFPAGECAPTRVDGLRVYLPGETRSLYVAHPTRGCTDTASHQLSHQAFRLR
jgi:hypothetical protein